MAAYRPSWLFALLFAGWNLPAQPPPAKLLTFDIAAVDAHENLIPDLRAEDFQVSDAGKRQQIVYFRRGQDLTRADHELARTRSNHAYATFPHATAVLLDLLNTRVEMKEYEWKQITTALVHAEQEREIYFYVLMKNGVLYPVRGMPDSWVAAAGSSPLATREILPIFDEIWERYRPRPTDLDLSRTGRASQEELDSMKRMQLLTATALQEMASRLAPVPGPKNIVWIVPHAAGQDPMGQPERLQSPAGESLDPGPLYYLGSRDASPLRANPTGWIWDAVGESIEPAPIYYLAGRNLDPAEIRRAIVRATADEQKGYRIGYYPPAANWDGRRHQLRITCARHGVRVRVKPSYMAVRNVDVEDDQRQTAPNLVAASPFDASTIRFRAVISPGESNPQLTLRVNPDDVLFDNSACSLAVQVVHYLGTGDHEVRHDLLIANFKLTAAERDSAQRDGLEIKLGVAALTEARQVRIVVMDRTTRSFGTLTLATGALATGGLDR